MTPQLIKVAKQEPPEFIAFRFWEAEEPRHPSIEVALPGHFYGHAKGGEFYVQDGGDVWEVHDGDWVILAVDDTFPDLLTPIDVRSDDEMFSVYVTRGAVT